MTQLSLWTTLVFWIMTGHLLSLIMLIPMAQLFHLCLLLSNKPHLRPVPLALVPDCLHAPDVLHASGGASAQHS